MDIKKILKSSIGVKEEKELSSFYKELDEITEKFSKGPVHPHEWAKEDGIEGIMPPDINWYKSQFLFKEAKNDPEILSIMITIFLWGFRSGNEYRKRKGI